MTGLLQFTARRLLSVLPVLFFVALVTFVLMHLTPGGPWDSEKALSPAAVANLNARYHLDLPAPQQFGLYLWSALHGDLGFSYSHPDQTVTRIIRQGAGVTLQLGLLAFAIALAVGLTLGLVGALRRDTWVDHLGRVAAVAGYSVPSFALATFAIVLFAAEWHLLPTGGWDSPKAAILPALTLAAAPMAAIARYTRTAMLDVLRQDYVRTARAKGQSELAIAWRHELKNALLPVVTILAPAIAYLVTGSFVVENVFHLPGMGRNYVEAVLARDYPLIMASTLLYAAAIVAANLLADLLYGLLDARIRE